MTATDGRLSWLERRRGGVGASDVPVLMGKAPGHWASPYSIWAEKVGLTPITEESSPAQRVGQMLEPLIAELFEAETGLYVAGEQMMIWRPGEPHFATVDGLVVESDQSSITDALGVFEAKYTTEPLGPWEAEHLEQYTIQANWAMHCADLDHAWLVVLCRSTLHVYELERDQPLIDEAVAVADRFWDYVERRESPPADGTRATTRALLAVHPTSTEDQGVEVDPEALDELRALREARARLDDAVAERENALREALGDHAYGRVGGRLAVSWKAQTSHRVDTKAVRRDHGHAYDTESTTRVLRYHGEAR